MSILCILIREAQIKCIRRCNWKHIQKFIPSLIFDIRLQLILQPLITDKHDEARKISLQQTTRSDMDAN